MSAYLNARVSLFKERIWPMPALDKLTQGIEDDGNPYLGLLFSLQSFLAGTTASDIGQTSTERQKECIS